MTSHPPLPKEQESGPIEYKLLIKPLNDHRLERLASQMQYRLKEGKGEAIYEIGVEDNGALVGIPSSELEASLRNLERIARKIKATSTLIRKTEVKEGHYTAEVLIRRVPMTQPPIEVTVSLAGNVDSGKSTMLGCLISGQLDDGQGKTRELVFNHPHESATGRTSSIATKILGFDASGAVTNYTNPELPPRMPHEILEHSSKLVRFVDLAGHEKYLKTTIYGITSNFCDYMAVVVGANAGILPMTREHLGLALALRIPFFIVVSKIDMAPHLVAEVMKSIKQLLKGVGVSKIPLVVKTIDDVAVATRRIPKGRVVPIFKVSFVTGENIDLLRQFLNLLPPRYEWKSQQSEDFLLYVQEVFPNVPGAGLVVSGVVESGNVKEGELVRVGPDDDGSFVPVKIKSIHYKRVPVRSAFAGQYITLALAFPKKYRRFKIRKGQVLTSRATPKASWSFMAEVFVLHHPTTIKDGYNSMVHCKSIRQQAVIELPPNVFLRTGSRATCKFRFLFQPEYVQVGQKFVFRDGRTKGLGTVIEVMHDE